MICIPCREELLFGVPLTLVCRGTSTEGIFPRHSSLISSHSFHFLERTDRWMDGWSLMLTDAIIWVSRTVLAEILIHPGHFSRRVWTHSQQDRTGCLRRCFGSPVRRLLQCTQEGLVRTDRPESKSEARPTATDGMTVIRDYRIVGHSRW